MLRVNHPCSIWDTDTIWTGNNYCCAFIISIGSADVIIDVDVDIDTDGNAVDDVGDNL